MLDRTRKVVAGRTAEQATSVIGMWGAGDIIHQRAVVRELMKRGPVYLDSASAAINYDLVGQGLRLSNHRSLQPRIRERSVHPKHPVPRTTSTTLRLSYDQATIKREGSILVAQFAAVGLKMPAEPDFSLPVPDAWRALARDCLARWPIGGRPLMILRPIVLNSVWPAPARCPDPKAYAALYAEIRAKFFVVSIANIKSGEDALVGPELDADVKLHDGNLDFETMAGLFAEAALVFANPGFTPVLAQAVGTPVIIVYGGNESFRTTNSVGAHLAPTLAIEPNRPCECHSRTHACDKRIALAPAIDKVVSFADDVVTGKARTSAPRVLIFGTTYVDTADKKKLLGHWFALHGRLNPKTDLLVVDSKSPLLWADDGASLFKPPAKGKIESFADNIGHLARGGRDGWGRAFCKGLKAAIDGDYDYVAHIEGDSLFRLPLAPIVRQMRAENIKVSSIPVRGTKQPETNWIETGLMVFDVDYLKTSGFIEKYDWPNRTRRPTPEAVIWSLLGDDLKIMPWSGERGDCGQIGNVCALDWITHCMDMRAYEQFVATALRAVDLHHVKLNFGCGTNRLQGWQNFDAEVNITQRLPFADGYADFILAEHCAEHVEYLSAMRFFQECFRVLKTGGVIRIAVPSIENVFARADQTYCAFVHKRGWAKTPDARGAVQAIIFQHGHRAAWTGASLTASLFAAGFSDIALCEPGRSAYPELIDVEGHGKVIGDHFNRIETVVCEAMK